MYHNKDRGTIKWTAMMLPEHVEMLRKIEHEKRKEPKPTIDDQTLEEYEYIICEAIEFNNKLTFKYWENGFYKDITGDIHFIDHISKKLHVKDDKGEVSFIELYSIISMN